MATILIADDDVDIRRPRRVKLISLGHDVVAVADGRAAFAAAKVRLPDLVVLDVMMPGVIGVEVVRILRVDPATVDLPVILLSGRAEPSEIEAGLACGANESLTKSARARLTSRRHTHRFGLAADHPLATSGPNPQRNEPENLGFVTNQLAGLASPKANGPAATRVRHARPDPDHARPAHTAAPAS